MGNIYIDFQVVDNHDETTISIQDYSNWEHIENKPSIIEIIIPGSSTPVTHYFQKHSTNIFNSITLGQNCNGCDEELLALPDGVYTIMLKGSPDTFNKTKSLLRTIKTELDLDKKLINLEIDCGKSKAKVLELFRIKMLLDSAKAHTRHGNICEAQELLFKAQDEIKKC